MSLKIFFVFLCAAIGTAAGYAVCRAFGRTSVYYFSVCELIRELRRKITERREPAVNVLRAFDCKSERLKSQISEYISYASAKDGELKLSRGFLPAGAYGEVCALFEMLGRSDGDAQIAELDRFYKSFGERESDAKEKSKKLGPLSVKLGFLFGLCVGILFL